MRFGWSWRIESKMRAGVFPETQSKPLSPSDEAPRPGEEAAPFRVLLETRGRRTFSLDQSEDRGRRSGSASCRNQRSACSEDIEVSPSRVNLPNSESCVPRWPAHD